MDKLSLVVDFILGDESEVVHPNFPPEDVPAGAPAWMRDWAEQGLCIDCEGRGYVDLPGNYRITCVACEGTRNRRNYLNGNRN